MSPHEANFDRVARLYRWAEYLTLGPLLQQTRTHFLPLLKDRRHALVLGDGDGRFLARLFQQQPDIAAVAVDTSARMLQLLRGRCLATGLQLRTVQASALDVEPSRDTDLIVTHFFLDCLTQTEVNQLTSQLAAPTSPGTLWLLSDFEVPQHPILRPLAAVYIRALYLAFRILTGLRAQTLTNPQAALTQAGFERIARHQKLGGLIYTELWRLR